VFFLGDQVLSDRYNRELADRRPGGVCLLPARLGPVVADNKQRGSRSCTSFTPADRRLQTELRRLPPHLNYAFSTIRHCQEPLRQIHRGDSSEA